LIIAFAITMICHVMLYICIGVEATSGKVTTVLKTPWTRKNTMMDFLVAIRAGMVFTSLSHPCTVNRPLVLNE
jgi:hypothetical protein